MEFDSITYVKLSKEKRKRIIEAMKEFLKKFERIKLAILFGSFLRREFVRDVDLGIYAFPPLTFEELLNLSARLDILLKIPVDVLQLKDVSPSFRIKILRNGIHIIEDRVIYHKLLSSAFSELQDFNFSFKQMTKILKI